MKRFLKYPLNIQLFVEEGGTGGEGGGTPAPTVAEEIETVPKSQFDKLSSDFSKLKKELNGKRTEDEQALELQRQKDEELENLKQFKTESTIRNQLLEGGIPKDQIDGIIKAYLNGEVDKLSKAITDMYSKGTSELQKTIDELKVTQIDTPQGRKGTKETTPEDFKNMTIDERIALKNNNPELFSQLNK